MKKSTWHDLEAEACKVASLTIQQAPAVCTLLQEALSTLADGFTSTIIPGTSANRVKMGLLSQNLNSLKCSVDLAMRGYYTQAINLLRGVYENWIAFLYLNEFPSAEDFWLCPSKQPPNHSAMLNALSESSVADKTHARGWYHTLCRFAHTDALVVLPHLGSHNNEACVFFGAKYKEDLFRSCAYEISRLSSPMLLEVSQWASSNPRWLERCNAKIGALQQFIKQENDEFKRSKEVLETNSRTW